MKIGPIISKPGSSLNYKTGSWRTGKKPLFLNKKCNGCKLCYLICPENCIDAEWIDANRIKRASLKCDFDFCKGCGLCAVICSVNDIQMIQETS